MPGRFATARPGGTRDASDRSTAGATTRARSARAVHAAAARRRRTPRVRSRSPPASGAVWRPLRSARRIRDEVRSAARGGRGVKPLGVVEREDHGSALSERMRRVREASPIARGSGGRSLASASRSAMSNARRRRTASRLATSSRTEPRMSTARRTRARLGLHTAMSQDAVTARRGAVDAGLPQNRACLSPARRRAGVHRDHGRPTKGNPRSRQAPHHSRSPCLRPCTILTCTDQGNAGAGSGVVTRQARHQHSNDEGPAHAGP